MTWLWNKPKDDDTYQKSEWLRQNTQEDEGIGIDYRALCSVYYDVFNNGGCNLELQSFQDDIERLKSIAVTYGLDYPPIFWWLDEDPALPGDQFETIDCDDMDRFARDVIENLYLSLNPEIKMGCGQKAMYDDMEREASWEKGLTPAMKRLDEIAVELKAGDLPLTREQHGELVKAARILDELTKKPWSAR